MFFWIRLNKSKYNEKIQKHERLLKNHLIWMNEKTIKDHNTKLNQ